MLVKYYQYNRPGPALELFISRMNEMVYSHYASKLLNSLLCSSKLDLEDSIKKAVAIFRLTGIPVQEHICGIYRSDFKGIRKDWQLSELACSLIILTSNATNEKVKEIQNELLEFYGFGQNP